MHNYKIFSTLVLAFALVSLLFSSNASAEVNDSETGFLLRGGLGAGRNLWGYVDHGSGSGDVGTGPGASLTLNGMFNYNAIGIEASYLFASIGDLEWSDKDNAGTQYDYKSTGSGYMSTFDLKLGIKMFVEEGDMGYTYPYVGLRFWTTERDQDTLEINGTKASYTNKREANGKGWILGVRDFSTIGTGDSFAIAIQSGFFFGKAPVDEMKTNGVKSNLNEKDNLSFGFELGGGVALENLGLSVMGVLKMDANITVFDDPAAVGDDESVFALGIWHFQVEASKHF
jgi:hypothetical protein